jgi:hypothetical protein
MLDTCLVDIKQPGGGQIIVDSSYFFIQNGMSAGLQSGETATWEVDTVFPNLPEFISAQPISKTSAIIELLDMSRRKKVFTKTFAPGIRKDVLQKQVDGIFCTDGFLQYSKSEGILVYTYRYRNQFICMDTSLNIVKLGKTIDTTSVAKIEVSETGGNITMSKPPFVVNKGTCVDARLLFVNSNLVAQNESEEIAKNRSVIDVYDISDGSYRYSFYIYDQAEGKMQSFKVKDSTLIAVFRNSLVRYNLATKYLSN